MNANNLIKSRLTEVNYIFVIDSDICIHQGFYYNSDSILIFKR